MPDRGQSTLRDGSADDDGGEAELGQRVDPRIVLSEIEEQHAVDAVLCPPAPVDRDLGGHVGCELEGERDRTCGELRLDPGEELGEEPFDRERARGPGEDEAARVGTGRRERPGGAVRPPAELVGDPEDAFTGRVGEAGAVVECVGDCALRDACLARDVLDRDAPRRLRPRRDDRLVKGVGCGHVRVIPVQKVDVGWPRVERLSGRRASRSKWQARTVRNLIAA